MNKKELATKIVKLVGGAQNIKSLTHCITRLRFVLKDDRMAKTKEIEQLDVVGVQIQGGQYQVIIGNGVTKVFREIMEQYPSLDLVDSGIDHDGEKKFSFNTAIGTLSSILVAALPPIVAGGMIQGLSFFAREKGWLDPESTLNFVLTITGNAMFFFLPFLIAVSAARKFKTNEYMALALAGIIMHPDLMRMVGENDPLTAFGFLPLPLIDYSSSILPILLGVWILKYVWNWIEKWMPDLISTVFTPLLTILIMAPVMLIGVAPVGFYIGDYLAIGIQWLIDQAPWLAGFVIGSTRPFLVIVGMHHAIRPIQLQQIATFGYTTITPANFLSTMATATATFSTYFLVKDKKQKQIVLSSAFSGFLGITEPALYGVLTKYKATMVGTLIGGGLGGMIATMMGARAYSGGMPSILTIPIFMGGGPASILVGLGVTVVSSFLITYLLGKTIFKAEGIEITDDKEEKEPVSQIKSSVVYSPAAGKVVELSQVSDHIFAEKILGEGIAIDAPNGEVVSPVTGIITTVFKTKHAIGITDENGVEVLIHIGIDTVKLEGKYFEVFCTEGQTIKTGDLLVKFDGEKIKLAGYESSVIVVVTNTNDFVSVLPEKTRGQVNLGEKMLTVIA